MSSPRSLTTVLAAVATSPRALSRAEVAVRTDLTKATVSTQVDRLVAAGLLVEGEPLPRRGAGRPAVGLRLDGDRVAAVGVEVGVDYLAGCLRDLGGTVRYRVVVPGDQRGRAPSAVLREVAGLAAVLRARAAEHGLTVAGLGIAVPGLVDAATGAVLLAPNLGWEGVDVVGGLACGRPGAVGEGVVVENEATLSALTEMGYPASDPESEVDPSGGLVVVSGEVGIGAGLVLDGSLVRGRRGWAGELGHVSVGVDGDLCRCGARGCLEVYAGQEAILRAAGRDPVPSTALGPQQAITDLVQAARDGDPPVLGALTTAGRALGVALSSAVNVLDVDAVVLGGIYAGLAPWVRPGIEEQLSVRALRSRLRPVRVVVSRVGPDAAVLGAAALVLRGVLAAPAPWVRA